MNPLVTVIVFVNSEQNDCLERTVKSVLKQTHKEFILYICCSELTVFTLEAVNSHRCDHPLIFVERHPKNSTLGSAIEATKTPYFGWLDSGDVLLPTALEETIEAIHASPETSVVYTSQSVVDSDWLVDDGASSSYALYSEEKLLTDFIVTQFRLIKRSVYEKVGGINHRLPHCQDYDLILRMSEMSNFVHIDKPLYLHRKTEGYMSHQEQIERILWAREIANQALQRRNLSSQYSLAVELLPKCYLVDAISSDVAG